MVGSNGINAHRYPIAPQILLFFAPNILSFRITVRPTFFQIGSTPAGMLAGKHSATKYCGQKYSAPKYSARINSAPNNFARNSFIGPNFFAPKYLSTMSARREQGSATAHAVQKTEARIGGPFSPQKNASFIQRRNAIFDKLLAKQAMEAQNTAKEKIEVTLPDGAVKSGISDETSPLQIAHSISPSLAKKVIVAKVKYEDVIGKEELVNAEEEETGCCAEEYILWDANRPLEGSCKLELLTFDHPQAKHVYWHSSSHILGQCLEAEFGAHLTVGPALTSGFYYDCYMGDTAITQDHYEVLEKHANRISGEKQKFERLVITKEEALELFKDNPFKVQLITNKIPDAGLTSCYRCGPFVDLCRGPHLPSTDFMKSFAITKHSSAYWLGQNHLDSLQRVYAISFPDKKQLAEYQRMLVEAKKRDHRTVGNYLDLFFFDTANSAGSCFWLPDGTKLYNRLCDFIRNEYRLRGFQEVITPNIYSCDLWKTSGHYQNYKENMYLFEIEGKEWGLKPMNCPGHCCIFKHMNPSYRHLPLRLADFGVLHRNEISGSLSGLTRVRRFQQDDAHIFCTMEQIKEEVRSSLEFLFYVYGCFGFEYELQLSTRPTKALGSKEQWVTAEKALEEALNESGKKWTLNAGDGAFYGPKVDIKLWDALKRAHQCGTIQLDFQLPLRFNLQYRTQEEALLDDEQAREAHAKGDATDQLRPGYARPVMIHRAILGSVERMVAVLMEHTGGKFPFWLSPRQAIVLPISDKHDAYARWLTNTLHNFGFNVELDESNNTMNKKIREAQLKQCNYMLVVGEQESSTATVTVRNRDDAKLQVTITVEELIKKFDKESMPHSQKLRNFVPWKEASATS